MFSGPFVHGGPQWKQAVESRADLCGVVKLTMKFACIQRWKTDPTSATSIPTATTARHPDDPTRRMLVRVVEYRLHGVESQESMYRAGDPILDPEKAPARELAALYHERWEIENAWTNSRFHLRGPQGCTRSRTPDLVRQEFYGFADASLCRAVFHA